MAINHTQSFYMIVFFLECLYKLKRAHTRFIKFEFISLSSLEPLDMPLTHMTSTQSFRVKLWLDFHNIMQQKIGSKLTHWIYVGNMSVLTCINIVKRVDDEFYALLMEKNWKKKVTKLQVGDLTKGIYEIQLTMKEVGFCLTNVS